MLVCLEHCDIVSRGCPGGQFDYRFLWHRRSIWVHITPIARLTKFQLISSATVGMGAYTTSKPIVCEASLRLLVVLVASSA
jgi:hypothetical protein|eukprot:COSAG02_NODE_800_length_17049_cov_14.510737_4_plen_81_part_00